MTRILRAFVHGRRALALMDQKNLGLIAAGVAFYAMLALFPGLAAVIALWGIIGDPGLVLSEMQRVEGIVPPEVEAVIEDQVAALASTDGFRLGWASGLSLVVAIWSARAGAAALMQGLNAVYGVPNRSGIAHYARALVLTIALIGVALTALLCVVIAPIVLSLVPFAWATQLVLEFGRWGLSIAVLLCGFALVYRLGPNLAVRRIFPGAFLATLLWAVASFGFSLYLANFDAYNETYGSIGAVIALLMWLFISAWLVLLGGALNAWLGQDKQPEPGAGDGQAG